ncbi:branched-chain amino acid transaminase [candidate division KSB1 bacterium]|nr:branched-chain amino acid transaminase [candidate division KSB1 bacterium]
MSFDEQAKVWKNGKWIAWKDATTHLASHVIHYGSSLFEGIRCYKTKKGSAIFRLKEHTERLFDSAKIYRMEIPYTQDEINAACLDIIRQNNYTEAYIRPVVYRGYGPLGVNPSGCPVEVVIMTWKWGAYLGKEALEKGVDVRVSSWNRFAPNTVPTLAKAGSNYMSSQLIKMEAVRDGYVEGIALTTDGTLSEGSGENLFVIRKGKIHTPPMSSAILPGITRDSVMTIAKELGYEVIEEVLPREILYIADEVFFTGTAAEVSPIRSVDKIQIGAGSRGPITKVIQDRLFQILTAEGEDTYGWLSHI